MDEAEPVSDGKPFVEIPTRRVVERGELPEDLRRFYATREGVGGESPPNRCVRLATLDEVRAIKWSDLHIFSFGLDPSVSEWEQFEGWRIGDGEFFDEIVYVNRAPCCDRGAIMVFGTDIAGPVGGDPDGLCCALVLATSFDEWIGRLERYSWLEYGLVPGGVRELSDDEQRAIRRHFAALNPVSHWAES